ncbi:MAG: helix-turn-helix transcriptional regulator [Clostridia bacterium]|nr:helix-turn-helix transcriptional regulator [Clostridia bacterium]
MVNKYKKEQLKKVGKNYQKARISSGTTQEDASEVVELSPSYISDLERGKTLGSIHTLIALCNLYKIAPNDVLYPLLDFEIDLKEPSMSGFYSLNSTNKEVITEMIRVLNEKQKNN